MRIASLYLMAAFAPMLAGQVGGPFVPGCALPEPLRSIQEAQEIDKSCGIEGSADLAVPATRDKLRLQNRAKNNFCAKGSPVSITAAVFRRLQQASDKRKAEIDKALKTDRALLASMTTQGGVTLGEGSLVRFVGFIHKAKHSNVGKGKGESVNCKDGRRQSNDIHVEIAAKANETNACNSVTAEISPHFRPESWDGLGSLDLEHRPVRFTGHLFFDGSHKPCANGKPTPGNPKRFSVWEIHPVYAVDVCKNTSLASCRADNEQHWIRLDQFEPGEEIEISQ